MILDGLHLQLGAILGFQGPAFIAAFVGANVLVKPRLVVLEQGRVAEGPLAVRPALGIHLQQTQIHAKLQLLLAIPGFESADHNLSGLIIPLVQEV